MAAPVKTGGKIVSKTPAIVNTIVVDGAVTGYEIEGGIFGTGQSVPAADIDKYYSGLPTKKELLSSG